MRKHFRMICGIIFHPFKRVYEIFSRYRSIENDELWFAARKRVSKNNLERMHHFAALCKKAYYNSPLYNNLYQGAPECY